MRGRLLLVMVLFLACDTPGTLTAAAASPSAAASTHEPTKAEFAIRWDPVNGGPQTAGEVLNVLGGSKPSSDKYQVRYFELPPPATTPPDALVVLRARAKEGGKTQIRLKYRLTKPLTDAWACPPGAAFEKEEEVDISFGAKGEIKRVYSYACSLKADAPPPFLNATPRGCYSTIARYEWNELKVEEWILPGGKRQLEVSRSGDNNDEQLASFREIVGKLDHAGVKPSDRSKSELGSSCP